MIWTTRGQSVETDMVYRFLQYPRDGQYCGVYQVSDPSDMTERLGADRSDTATTRQQSSRMSMG